MTFNASCVSLSPSIFRWYVSIGAISKAFFDVFFLQGKYLNEGFSFRKHTATSLDNEFCAGPLFHFLNLFKIMSLFEPHIADIISLIPLKDQGHSIPSFV